MTITELPSKRPKSAGEAVIQIFRNLASSSGDLLPFSTITVVPVGKIIYHNKANNKNRNSQFTVGKR